jgi:hypothetical protein
MSNSLAQQWFKWEKPIQPDGVQAGGSINTGYATRLAAGPQPNNPVALGSGIFSNQFRPASGAPPSNYPNDAGTFNAPLSTVAPVGVVMGTGWLYNFPARMCQINATPAGNVDLVCTMDQGAPALTIGEKIQIWITGFMQSGTVTVLQGGVATGSNISATNWNAAVVSPPGLGVYRILITAVAVGNTITLRFPAGTLAQAQFNVVSIVRGYAAWTDFMVTNAAQMNA